MDAKKLFFILALYLTLKILMLTLYLIFMWCATEMVGICTTYLVVILKSKSKSKSKSNNNKKGTKQLIMEGTPPLRGEPYPTL